MEDLYKEHNAGFHTSEDWETLQNRCSECSKVVQSMKWNKPTRSTEERNQEALSRLDYSFKNPLEERYGRI